MITTAPAPVVVSAPAAKKTAAATEWLQPIFRPTSVAVIGASNRDDSDAVYDAIFAQAGILRVDSVEELFDFAVGFSRQPLPKGNRFAIVTNAGGPGIMATDAAIRHGLELAKLRPETLDALKAKLPPTANFSNPVDVIGDATNERYQAALTAVLGDPDVDGLGVLLNISTAEDAGAGYEKITNGVKQKLPGARLLGVEVDGQ